MSYKEDSRYFKNRSENTVICNCGHRMAIPSFLDKKICDWCGKMVYKDKKVEFNDKIKSQLLKKEKQ